MGVKRYRRHSAVVCARKQWRAVRHLALKRDGFKCVECGARGRLEVDHIQPVRLRPDLAYNLENCQTLCVSCHSRKTRIEIGLGTIDPRREEWRAAVSALQSPSRKETINA